MTMKKIALSALAATMVTSLALAGTISPTASGDKIGTELLSVQDVNVSNVFANAVYEPTNIPSGAAANPVIKYTFTNLKDLDTNATAVSNAGVYLIKNGDDTNLTA
ncbi:MAG: hypothetical protein U9R50_08020, partial [Campylobacterota bacterium]|nr:hypothetical protein [Campylobacterota bacterium]